MIGEAVFHRETERAAERVQSEDRVIGVDVGVIDRDGQDKIEVDAIAEGLVDAHAILIDREPFRGSRNAGGVKATVEEVRRKVRAVHVDADRRGNMIRQRISHSRRFLILELLCRYS